MGFSRFFLTFSIFMLPFCIYGETIKIDQVSLHWKPELSPRVFQGGMIYPNSKPVLGTELHRSYMESLSEAGESFVYLETADRLEDILAFYEKFFKENDWKLLKRVDKEKSFVLLGESSTRRVFTVLVHSKNDQRIIKLYHKKQVSF